MKRSTRHTALIIFLQGRKYTTLDDITSRFGISGRTAYRDLQSLQEAGIPIGCDSGKGYFIVSGFHLQPVVFSREEAVALVSAGYFLKEWSETSTGEAFRNALEKIRAVLRYEEKDYLDVLDKQMRAHRWPDEKSSKLDPRVFQFLQEVIYRRRVVRLNYQAVNREMTVRDAEPLGLLMIGDHWYLAAWCRLRKGYRMFRIDRIREYSDAGVKFSEYNGHTLEAFYENIEKHNKEMVPVVIRVSNEVLRYLDGQKYYNGWSSEKAVDGGMEMSFYSYSLDHFARWLLGWGDGVEVLEPESLKSRVRELAEKSFRHYDKNG